MREPDGGGHRPPPKSPIDDGSVLGLSSGDWAAASGDLKGKEKGSAELNMLMASPVCDGYMLNGVTGDHMELSPDGSGVSCESGKNINSLRYIGGDVQSGSSGLDAGTLCGVQESYEVTCMALHDDPVPLTDACMDSSAAQVDEDDTCMVFKAAACVAPSFPPPSSNFHMGSSDVNDAGSSVPSSQHYRTPTVCGNVSPKFGEPVKVFGSDYQSVNPWERLHSAWKKPAVVPLVSVADLGQYSVDESTAILDEEEVDLTLKRFEHAIFGRMFGRKIPYSLLSCELLRRWGAFGRFRLITLSSDCFVCIFDSSKACEAVLVGGPWVILGQVLGINKWSSTFSPSSSDGFKTPVWVRMPSLPLYCWGSKNISRIAALVGEPLCMDAATDQIDKGNFAHACVCIDLSKPLKPGVWIKGRHGRFFQRLEYEGLSVFCHWCCQVGHKASACKAQFASKGSNIDSPLISKNNAVDAIQESHYKASQVGHKASAFDGKDTHNSSSHVIPNMEQLADECEAGPWMMVRRKQRSSKSNQQFNQSLHNGSSINRTQNYKMINGMSGSQRVDAVHSGSALPSRKSGGGCLVSIPGGSQSVNPASAMGMKGTSTRAANAQAVRASRSFKDRMVSELGPVAHGPRKRRKVHSSIDGGDASPLP